MLTRYVPVEINPRLIEDIEQPELKGDTWRDIGVLSVEQRGVITEFRCRGYVLRGEDLPDWCDGSMDVEKPSE